MGGGTRDASVDLFWLPLGAGGYFVRWNGRLYERWSARREGRPPCDLYHCGLMVHLRGTAYAVEMGPVWNVTDPDRGVVVEEPVGARCLGRFRAFRYEVRCWPGGHLPDVSAAVESPVRLTEDLRHAAAVVRALPDLPVLTWGRDELGTGEMWNSNSAVAWVLARTSHDVTAIRPPRGGRAPGWDAGLALADRQSRAASGEPTVRDEARGGQRGERGEQDRDGLGR